jgi:hypothetical protein
MATVSCPSCGRALEVEAEYRDWTVRCPHCESEFVPADLMPEDDPLAPAAADDRPRRRRSYEDDEDDRPRRRRRYEDEDDDYDDDYDYRPRRLSRAGAERAVAAPAQWLEICGWGTAVLTVLLCLLFIALAGMMQNNPAPRNRNAGGPEPELFLFYSFCFGIFGLPYSVLMAIGGRKMRTLSSYGWAMTGAIMGIMSLPLFGLCGAVQTGIGIWAVVALNKPGVRDAFGGRRRRRSRDEWDD